MYGLQKLKKATKSLGQLRTIKLQGKFNLPPMWSATPCTYNFTFYNLIRALKSESKPASCDKWSRSKHQILYKRASLSIKVRGMYMTMWPNESSDTSRVLGLVGRVKKNGLHSTPVVLVCFFTWIFQLYFQNMTLFTLLDPVPVVMGGATEGRWSPLSLEIPARHGPLKPLTATPDCLPMKS